MSLIDSFRGFASSCAAFVPGIYKDLASIKALFKFRLVHVGGANACYVADDELDCRRRKRTVNIHSIALVLQFWVAGRVSQAHAKSGWMLQHQVDGVYAWPFESESTHGRQNSSQR